MGADNVRCRCEYFHLAMIMMMMMMKRLTMILMILMIRAITSQKESCLSEFLPLAEMLTNLEM